MEKLFLSCLGLLFCLLLLVQGHTALTLREDRIAEEERIARATEQIDGMTTHLTVETANNAPSHGVLCINGIEKGSFQHGILTVAVTEGDILSIKNATGETFCIVDYPVDLSRNMLSETLFCDQTVTKWGKISFE